MLRDRNSPLLPKCEWGSEMPTTVAARMLGGNVPRDQIPEGDEWGWAKWCFDKGGRIRTWTVACPRFAGCDGGDGENLYRWHEDHLEITFVDTDDKNPTYMGWVWRPCAVNFPTKDKILISNCLLWTLGEWVRVRDPDKGDPATQRLRRN
jgi:hypothetical protein